MLRQTKRELAFWEWRDTNLARYLEFSVVHDSKPNAIPSSSQFEIHNWSWLFQWRFPAKTGALMQNGFLVAPPHVFKSNMLILIHLRALWAMLITFKTRYTWQQFHVEGSHGHITWLVQDRVSPPRKKKKKERERESAKEDQQIPDVKKRETSLHKCQL